MSRLAERTKAYHIPNHMKIISLLTGDFGRAKTPTIANVKASYFPLTISESVGI